MLEGMKFVPLTDQQLSEVRGGMFAVTTGTGKQAMSPASQGNFSAGDLRQAMMSGALGGAIAGSRTGNPAIAAKDALAGALGLGMEYAATHSSGKPEFPSNNIRTFPYMISRPSSHPQPPSA